MSGSFAAFDVFTTEWVSLFNKAALCLQDSEPKYFVEASKTWSVEKISLFFLFAICIVNILHKNIHRIG